MPCVYYRTSGINVQFDEENMVHEGLQIGHFILLNVTETVSPEKSTTPQKARDLYGEILFYQDDIVRETTDLLKTNRTVKEVIVRDDRIMTICELSETPDERIQREKLRELAIEARRVNTNHEDVYSMSQLLRRTQFDEPENRRVGENELALVGRGNVYNLYCDPAKLAFSSDEEEILFWGRDGISYRHYGVDDTLSSFGGISLEEARAQVQAEEADIIIRAKEYKNIVCQGGGDYYVRSLHTCFSQFRKRARNLSLMIEKPPQEAVNSMRQFMKGSLLND